MVKLVNRAKMKVASGGASTLTLGLACDGYQSFAAAGVVDQDKLRYTITDGDEWEIGVGTYTASGTTLARAVTESSNSGNAITCSSEAEIFVTMAAEDFTDNAAPIFANTIPSSLDVGAGSVSTINAAAVDDFSFPVSYSFDAYSGSTVYNASSLPPQIASVGINQTTGVFTLTASSNASHAGSLNFRVRASDGVRTAAKTITYTLNFLPTSGLVGYYDMKDYAAYSGSWADTSGTYNTSGSSNGPNLTVSSSLTTYNASGTGGIASLTLAAGTNAVKAGPSYPTNLTNTSSPYDNTVVMILAKPASQTSFYLMATSTSQGYALLGSSGSSTSLATGTSLTGSWVHPAANTTSKVYIDKVDATAYTENEVLNAFASTANADKYHSVVLTNGHFLNGWSTGNIHPALVTMGPIGELRAVVFYDRALTASEVVGIHGYFASDYSSSEMIQ